MLKEKIIISLAKIASIFDLELLLLFSIVTIPLFKNEVLSGSHYTIIIIGTIGLVLFFISSLRRNKIIYPEFVTKSFILLTFWFIISTIFSSNKINSLWELVLLIACFVIFISVYNIFYKNIYKRMIFLYIFSLICFIVLVLNFSVFSFNILNNIIPKGTYFQSILSWHNQTAGLLLFLIPCLLAITFSISNFWIKVFLSICSSIAFSAMVLTYSRGGLLSLFLSILLFIALSINLFKKNWKYLLLIVLLTISLIALIATPKEFINTTGYISKETIKETDGVNNKMRISLWKNTFKIIHDYPIVGIGPGNFKMRYHSYQDEPWLYAAYTHNYFLQLAAETGLPGLIVFIVIFVSTMISVINKLKKHNNTGKDILFIGVLCGVFGSILHTFVDIDWSRVTLYIIFWIFIGILLSSSNLKEKSIKIKRLNNKLYLMLLLIFVIFVELLTSDKLYERALFNLGQNNLIEAKNDISKAIWINPIDDNFLLLQGQIYQLEKNNEKAAILYKKALSISPFDPNYYFRLGQIEMQNKNFAEAERLFKKTESLSPYSDPSLYSNLSDLYLMQNKLQLAEALLNDAINNKFPLDRGYFGFKYLYDATNYTNDIEGMYERLIFIEYRLHKNDKAKKLINILEAKLDAKHILLPAFRIFYK